MHCNRFKLHLIVRDDTETCKLLLLNTVAKTIVGHEAVDLWDDSYDVVSLVPAFKNLI